MEVDFSPSDFISSVLYQNKKVYPNSKYEIDLNIVTSNQEESFVVFVYDEKNTYLNIQTFKGNSSLKLSISPNSISDLVGFVIRPNGYNTSGTVTLNDANISLVGSGNQCDWSSFAIFGTKQFQDSLGGNFGDYMLNIVDNDVTPKMLTHFDTITLFPENSFILPDGSNRTFYYELKGYFNALIPSSTFYLSDGGNNLFLEFNTFDSLGNSIDSYRQKVENKDDGIYTIDFFGQSGFVEFDNGYAQFIIIPANKLVDGDGGTYDDNFPANWNITPIDIGNSINSVLVNYDGQNIETGEFDVLTNDLQTGFDAVAQFESEIQTTIGKEYIIETDVYVYTGFDPRQANGKTEVYLGVNGIDESNLSFTTAKSPTIYTNRVY